MTFLALFLLIGGSVAGLLGLGGIDLPDVDPEDWDEADTADRAISAQNNQLLVGSDAPDLLESGGGADWLLGFDGEDSLTGGNGGDVLIGGADADTLDGGAGNDFIEAANVIDEAALRGSAAGAISVWDVTYAYDLPAASDAGDLVRLGPGDDTVVAGSGDSVTGGAGLDEFSLGDWIEGGQPVEIEDFDAAEDVISFVYDRDGPAPELTVEHNERTGVTTIRADGQAVAVLRDGSPDFSVRNIAVGRYAA